MAHTSVTLLTTIAITSAGAALGARFKYPILLPSGILIVVAVCAFDIAHGNSFWTILWNVVVSLAALEIGYLGGAIISFVVANRRRKELPPMGAFFSGFVRPPLEETDRRILLKQLVSVQPDIEAFAAAEPDTMRHLERLCSTCTTRRICRRDLHRGGSSWRSYCPAAHALIALQP